MFEKEKNLDISKKEEKAQKDKLNEKNEMTKNEKNINGIIKSYNIKLSEKNDFGKVPERENTSKMKENSIEIQNNINDSLDAIINNVINNKNNLITPTKNSIINSSLFYTFSKSSEKQLSDAEEKNNKNNDENNNEKENENYNENNNENDNSSSNNHNILNTHDIMKDLVKNDNSNSLNKTENAIYLFDSDDDKEEENKKNKENNTNKDNNSDSNLEYKNSDNPNNNNDSIINKINQNDPQNINQKNEINNQDKELLSKINNNLNNNVIVNKENGLNDVKCHIKKEDKILYYRRRITSSHKLFQGKNKINIEFTIGEYKQNESFPSFIFGSKQFHYTPENYRQISLNYKGYFMKCTNLNNLFKKRVIENDIKHLCTYHFRQKRGRQSSFDICVSDEKTLNDGVFLNDKIINFYLKILEDELTCIEGKTNQVLVQRSFFYNSLSNQNIDLSDTFRCPDSFSFIKTKVNIFTFKTLIIPICEHYHWSLIIVNDVDKMKNIFSNENTTEENDNYKNNINLKDEENDYPEIFYLDSIYNINNRRTHLILKYLFYEYQKVYSIQCNIDNFFYSNFNKIECSNPNVPKQDNSYDCGIFILMYADLFLYDPEYFLKHASKKYKFNSQNNNEVNKINNINVGNKENNKLENIHNTKDVKTEDNISDKISKNNNVNFENNKSDIINKYNIIKKEINKYDNINNESIVNNNNEQKIINNNIEDNANNKINNINHNCVANNDNNKINNINGVGENSKINITDNNTNTNNNVNNTVSNNYIKNNNIINNINFSNNNILTNIINSKNINIYNYSICNSFTNENINSDNIMKNNIKSLNIHDNSIINKDKNKNEFFDKLNNNKITDNNKINNEEKIVKNESEINNNIDLEAEQFDIEIENSDNKLNNNDNVTDLNMAEKREINNKNNESQNTGLNNYINYEGKKEVTLKNWFSLELINNQRNKIKKLINELSKMEKEIDKNDIDKIMKEQNNIIKIYMEQQKKEFDNYFLKLRENNNN